MYNQLNKYVKTVTKLTTTMTFIKPLIAPLLSWSLFITSRSSGFGFSGGTDVAEGCSSVLREPALSSIHSLYQKT